MAGLQQTTKPICLDLTRLLSRTGQILTGVDRVEWAYLEWCISLDRPVYGLVRSAFGYLLMDRSGLEFAYAHLRVADWGKPDVLSRFALKLSPARRAAETALRKCAVARATPARLAHMLRRAFPHGVLYLNTGHSNLTRRVFGAFKSLGTAQSVVLIHDMIPLDWPEYQRAGTVDQFEKRMRIVSEQADALICNSRQTLDDTTRHMERFGRLPPAIVAHLGVDLPAFKVVASPEIPQPYVITIGTIEPRKNHAFLLDLWEEWPTGNDDPPPPHLVICGNRGWRNEDVFTRLDAVKAKGLPITELNGLRDDQIMGLLKGAKAALFPSLAEGFGLPQVEALSLGVPIICGDLAIYREVLGDFPVYAETSNAYVWRTEIEKMLQKDSDEIGRVVNDQAPYTAPRWDAHFNLVLKHFG
ncbi:glycosyltransferase family 4 protein [Planktotalea arctica]|uniref:glycosyltransferase family 4 protein n=1 Tax=Planktotalea arctica TaxID=1481893 RepID=UPI000A17301E|nr:glycosyltransferase family 1 protein [Planktotalea arctica]